MTQETRKKLPPGISQTTMYLLTAKAIGYDLVEWNVAVYVDEDLAKNHRTKATRWKNRLQECLRLYDELRWDSHKASTYIDEYGVAKPGSPYDPHLYSTVDAESEITYHLEEITGYVTETVSNAVKENP